MDGGTCCTCLSKILRVLYKCLYVRHENQFHNSKLEKLETHTRLSFVDFVATGLSCVDVVVAQARIDLACSANTSAAFRSSAPLKTGMFLQV